MKLKHKIFIFCFSFIIKTKAQNLVPNGSFEIYSNCPDGLSQINKATPWYDPTGASSDYFNVCDTGYANVPYSSLGYQHARTGLGYAGLFALNWFYDDGREYIQVKLDSVLIADSCYLVQFYCNLHNNMDYAINRLGAYLSNTAVSNVGPGSVMSYTPQIIYTLFLTDTLNWMRIAGYYKATGGEKYITIGDFKPFSTGDTLNIGNANYPGAYYYIDDVSLEKLPRCDTTLSVSDYIDNSLFKLYPNPNDGNMVLEYQLAENENGMLIIYDITGKAMGAYKFSGNTSKIAIDASVLNSGVYLYDVFINDSKLKTDKIIIAK